VTPDPLAVLVVVRDLEVGGAPRLYIDLLERLGAAGHRVGIASAGGTLAGQARAAGITLHEVGWEGRAETYAAVASAAAGYDAALVTCDPWLLPVVPAALAGCGRAGLIVLSHAGGMADWFGAPGITALSRLAAALAAAPEGAVIVRGPVQRRLLGELLGLAATALDVLEPGVPADRIPFAPAGPDDGTVLVLSRLGPDTVDRVRAGVELVAAGRAQGRDCRLLLIGDGVGRDDALTLCASSLPADAWAHEGLITDPVAAYARADVVVAMGRAAFEAAAHGRPVATSRRAGDGRGVLGPPLTPEHYDEFADDLLGMGYEPWEPAAVWHALDGLDQARRAAVRARVLERNSGARQAADAVRLLEALRPSASAGLIGAAGAATADALDALAAVQRTAEELWAARNWYEGQLRMLRD
jgi:Glycosyl transferases group 1